MGTNGDFWGLNFMGTTGKTIDVIPQVTKSSHYLPPTQSGKLIIIVQFFIFLAVQGRFSGIHLSNDPLWNLNLSFYEI